MDFSTLKRPSAWIPIAMSLAALALVLGYLAIYGVGARSGDEGATAHTWQLLMAGQLPVIAYFAIRWLPQAPRKAALVVALQVVAALAALAPVYLLRL
jgi:hypothetical protein